MSPRTVAIYMLIGWVVTVYRLALHADFFVDRWMRAEGFAEKMSWVMLWTALAILWPVWIVLGDWTDS